MALTFPNQEKLKSKKAIEQLFEEGKAFKKFPVRLLYLVVDEAEKTKVGFTVPKRNFKLAVDRNRVKRQLREAYRLQKPSLEKESGKKFVLMFLFMAKKEVPYAHIEKAMTSLLKQLKDV